MRARSLVEDGGDMFPPVLTIGGRGRPIAFGEPGDRFWMCKRDGLLLAIDRTNV
jgi:hypothetical protein